MSVMKVYKNGQFKVVDNTATKIGQFTLGFEFQQLSNNIPSWALPYLGGEYLRSSYAELWELVQKQDRVITDAEWLALNEEHGSVPYYSSGDGSTTFRVPKVVGHTEGATSTSEVGKYGDLVSNIVAENEVTGEIIDELVTPSIKVIWCVKAKLDTSNDSNIDVGDYVNFSNPSLSVLYSRSEGDDSSIINLTEPFTNYKGLVLVYSDGHYVDTKIKWNWELELIGNDGNLVTSDTTIIDESTLEGAFISKVYGIS